MVKDFKSRGDKKANMLWNKTKKKRKVGNEIPWLKKMATQILKAKPRKKKNLQIFLT